MTSEIALVKLAVFLACSYALGHIFRLVKTSPILGQLVAGALLGPGLARFAPTPDGLALAGLLGIQLSVIDAGLCTSLATLRTLAPRALLVAVLGILLPLAGAVAVVVVDAVLRRNFVPATTLRAAFAVGAALAPTSLGVTARLLAEVGELDSYVGKLISIAAVFDDVIGLILLAEVQAAAKTPVKAWTLIRPALFSILFIVVAMIVAVFLPPILTKALTKAPVHESARWRLALACIFAVATLATYGAVAAGTSFLLAGYLTGVALADVADGAFANAWKGHVVVHIDWLVLLFFAATIGFVIPIRSLFNASALALGAVLALVATFGKLLCGVGAGSFRDGVAVGVAMLGRGEFGFLIATSAYGSRVLNDTLYAATIWGVLVPTLLTPILFGFAFRWRRNRIERSARCNGSVSSRSSDGSQIVSEAPPDMV